MAAMVVDEEEEDGAEETTAAAPTDPCVALRLVAAAAWHVVRERQIHDFPRVLALLEAVGEVAPNLVHFQHLAKLRLGLQAKLIMNMFQEQQPEGKIYDAIDMCFPEREPRPNPKATAQDMRLVQAAQENFRVLVLGLLSNRRNRDKYVQEHLENDYGEAFLHVVEELFCDYLWQLESTLPEPSVQQLLEAACAPGPSQPSPDRTILFRYLADMGYQSSGSSAHPAAPSQSNPSSHNEEQRRQPRKNQSSPSRGRRQRRCLPCAQENDSQDGESGLQLPDNQEGDESEDVVSDSNSEGGHAPFVKGDYQCTQHNTLIPTFQEHLQPASS